MTDTLNALLADASPDAPAIGAPDRPWMTYAGLAEQNIEPQRRIAQRSRYAEEIPLFGTRPGQRSTAFHRPTDGRNERQLFRANRVAARE